MIRTLLQTAGAALAVASLVALPGCGGSEAPADKAPSTQSGHYAGDGHDHGDEAATEHPAEGPHGGYLIELGGGEYHAELLHDESTNTATIHLLDAAGKNPAAILQPEIALQLFQGGQFVKYALKAVQGPEDTAGAASRFEIVDAALCDALLHDDDTRGHLQVTINGKPFTGAIEHDSHGDDHR
jgi:hypothetical protein